MILICNYDSAVHAEEPRWHKPMPTVPTHWWIKLWAKGANGAILDTSIRVKQPCQYGDLLRQEITPLVDEIREECDGVMRFKFWVYKAR